MGTTSSSIRPVRLALALALSVLASIAVVGQSPCALAWNQLGGLPGPNGPLEDCVRWDPDGAGPAAEIVVFGGRFTACGTVAARNLAGWEPLSGDYVSLGAGTSVTTGPDRGVRALAVLPSGELVVAGAFDHVDGQPIQNLAWFDGTSWQPLGGGCDGEVSALEVLPNGDLVVGGLFLHAGGVPATRLARWDGVAWHAMGAANGEVEHFATLANGDLVAAGGFGGIDGILMNGIARWDGTSWSALGSGLSWTGPPAFERRMRRIEPLPGGGFVICGVFTAAGGQPTPGGVASWSGGAWSAMGDGLLAGQLHTVLDVLLRDDGTLLGVGYVHDLQDVHRRVLVWDGADWLPFGPKLRTLQMSLLALAGGEVLVPPFVFDQGVWRPMPGGPDGRVHAIALAPNGDVLIGGSFQSVGGVMAAGVACWDGSSWRGLGEGVQGYVSALQVLSNGDVVVGGTLWQAGSHRVRNVARWDGARWHPIAGGLDAPVKTLLELPNGNVLAGGSQLLNGVESLVECDGAAWRPFGGGVDGDVTSMLLRTNGDLVVAGDLFTAGGASCGDVISWANGWSQLVTGWPAPLPGPVRALAELTDGSLVAASVPGTASPIVARWSNSTWASLGTLGGGLASVRDMLVLPDGDLVVAGNFSSVNGVAAEGLARWDGGNWSSLVTWPGTSGGLYADTVAFVADGLVVGGWFRVDQSTTGYLGRIESSCPARVEPVGVGCAGAPASGVIAADPPWLGGPWQLRAHGLPSPAIVAVAHGAAGLQVPLANLFAAATPGCALLVAPDFVDLRLSLDGTVAVAHDLPSSPPLVGATFHSQVLPFALGPGGAVATVTSTDALRMTFGAF